MWYRLTGELPHDRPMILIRRLQVGRLVTGPLEIGRVAERD